MDWETKGSARFNNIKVTEECRFFVFTQMGTLPPASME
jgi:hypothetical protein